jgi:hypothetical protein
MAHDLDFIFVKWGDYSLAAFGWPATVVTTVAALLVLALVGRRLGFW